jgi:uncharacterized OB-fold protein
MTPVTMMDAFLHLEYTEALAPVVRRYAEALMDGRIIGHRCPRCGLVYVPPRGYCPICVIVTTDADEIALRDHGVVTNYTVVTPVQYYGQEETQPFVRASILLDEAGGMMSLQDVDVPVDVVRAGMRVEAVWVPDAERTAEHITNRSWGNAAGFIRSWRPTNEPDVAADRFTDQVF